MESMIHPLEGAEGIRPRRFLRAATIVVVLLVMLVGAFATRPFWQGPLHRIFPPPPYTGTSIYGLAPNTAAGAGTMLVALRSSDGKERWHYPNVAEYQRILEAHDRIFILDATQSHLIALRASDGHSEWSLGTEAVLGPDAIVFPIDLAGTSLLLLEFDHGFQTGNITKSAVVMVNQANGRVRWSKIYPRPINVSVNGNTVLTTDIMTDQQTGTQQTAIASLAAATGDIRWTRTFDSTGYGPYCALPNPLYVFCNASVPSSVSPRSVVRTYAIESGQLLWTRTFDTSVVSTLNSTTFMTSPNYTRKPNGIIIPLAAYDLATGILRWQIKGNFGDIVESINGKPGIVLVNDATGFSLFDHDSGALLRHLDVAVPDGFPMLLFTATDLYAQDATGMYRLTLTSSYYRHWDLNLVGPLSLVTDPQHLILADVLTTRAFDATSGVVLWMVHQPLHNIMIA